MKKNGLFVIFLVMFCLLFSSCAKKNGLNEQSKIKEGIGPYEYNESELALLETMNYKNKVGMVSFKAPKSAKNMEIKVYLLNDMGEWEEDNSGKIMMNDMETPIENFQGNVCLICNENHSIEYHINTTGCGGCFYKTEEIISEEQEVLFSRVFLSEQKDIELNQEIPIAVMLYDSGTSFRTFTTDDYFNPEKFKGKDIVQAVVLKFTD